VIWSCFEGGWWDAGGFFLFTLVTGPRRSLSLRLSDTRVYEPHKRARLDTTQEAAETAAEARVSVRQELHGVQENLNQVHENVQAELLRQVLLLLYYSQA